MGKKHEQDFADLEVKRLCGVFGTPIPALPPERDKALDKVKEPKERRKGRELERCSAAVSDCALPSSVSGVLLQPPRTEPSSAPWRISQIFICHLVVVNMFRC